MRSIVLGFVASLVGTAFAEDAGDVEVLTESSFDDYVAENKYVLVEFYAPWCGHCKALKPEYAKAATELKTAKSPVRLAMIDATEEKDLASKFDVRGYPTLLWFVNGKKAEYDGGRTSVDILEWIAEATQPPVKDLSPSSPVPTPSGRRALVILSGPESLQKAFTAVAEKNLKTGEFFFSLSTKSVLSIQHKAEDAIKKEFASAEAATEAALAELVEAHAFPLFGELNGKSYSRYMERSRGMLWLLPEAVGAESAAFEKAVEQLRATGVSLAKKLPEYSVVYIDTVQFKDAVANMLGVSVFPAAALHLEAGDKKKFVFEMAGAGATLVGKEDAIAEWVRKAEKGEVQPSYKSEAIPEKNETPVKTVVGANLEKMVFQEDKDVLLAITATWCGHCKKMKPEYEKLAKKVAKEGLDKVLMIANMDGTLNDSPVDEIAWQGFPTIFYVKAGSRQVIPYEGTRDAKGFWKWLKANHSQKELFAKTADKKDDKADTNKDEL